MNTETTPTPELVALLACPFCGGEPRLIDLAGWEIDCKCGLSFCLPTPDKAALVTAWNTRVATVPQVSDDVARMDWLEARGYPGQFYAYDDGPPNERWFDSETPGSDYSPTLRAAIDAAMTPPPAEASKGDGK